MPQQKLLVWRQMLLSLQTDVEELQSCLSPGLNQERKFLPLLCIFSGSALPICPFNLTAHKHFTLSSPLLEGRGYDEKGNGPNQYAWMEGMAGKGEVQVHNLTQRLESTSVPQVMYCLVKQVNPEGSSSLLRAHLCQSFSCGLPPLSAFLPREPYR